MSLRACAAPVFECVLVKARRTRLHAYTHTHTHTHTYTYVRMRTPEPRHIHAHYPDTYTHIQHTAAPAWDARIGLQRGSPYMRGRQGGRRNHTVSFSVCKRSSTVFLKVDCETKTLKPQYDQTTRHRPIRRTCSWLRMGMFFLKKNKALPGSHISAGRAPNRQEYKGRGTKSPVFMFVSRPNMNAHSLNTECAHFCRALRGTRGKGGGGGGDGPCVCACTDEVELVVDAGDPSARNLTACINDFRPDREVNVQLVQVCVFVFVVIRVYPCVLVSAYARNSTVCECVRARARRVRVHVFIRACMCPYGLLE